MNTAHNTGKVKQKKLGRYLHDFYLRHLYVTRNNWDIYRPTFAFLDRSLGLLLSIPFIGPRIKGKIRLDGSMSQGYFVPINRDLNYQGKTPGAVTPISMVRKAIEESSYRMIMNKCMCRDYHTCKNYPIELACIMLGEACRKMVGSGIARYVTVEEALDHLERAAQLGLVATCAWVEIEATLMGISPEQRERYMEICLCCPCCCVGVRQLKKAMSIPFLKDRFRSVGWKACDTDDCISCGQCVDICPMEAIESRGKGISVSEECMGCMLCAFKCPEKAIAMEEIEPMKDHILDYFRWFRPQVRG
jgi:Pyruvate/2-oxoacid:ferredoxin oxidoreductase delta subunit